MASFVILQDSPARPTISSLSLNGYNGISLHSMVNSPSFDKENVNPLTCRGSTTLKVGKKTKRKYIRENGAGPLAVKRRCKVAFIGVGASPMKKNEKRRRVLGGMAPAPLTRTDTTILNEFVDAANRRAVELTVSPLADASEAYLSLPGSPSSSDGELSIGVDDPFVYLENSAFPIDSKEYSSSFAPKSTISGISPLAVSLYLDDLAYFQPASGAISKQDAEEICLSVPLPSSSP